MFKNLFKSVQTTVKEMTHVKSNNEIIEEIHDTFYTEVDRLLAEAMIEKSEDTTKQDLIDKCNKLKKLGFSNTKEVKEAEVEIKRLNSIRKENRNKTELTQAINYFSQKYPQYRFITEESVKKICAKYNLVYSTINRYIGTVPDKNLEQMQQFKIDDKDGVYLCEIRSRYISIYGRDNNITMIPFNNYQEVQSNNLYKSENEYILDSNYNRYYKAPLEIAAPLKDFNLDKSEIKDFKINNKIEIPDPVVLQPVQYNGNKYFLIITAWGLEASDELVVNHKMN